MASPDLTRDCVPAPGRAWRRGPGCRGGSWSATPTSPSARTCGTLSLKGMGIKGVDSAETQTSGLQKILQFGLDFTVGSLTSKSDNSEGF